MSTFTFGQAQYSPAACKLGAKTNEMLGLRLKLRVDKEMVVRKDRDVDYASYAVRFGDEQDRAWLNGIFGPFATSGQVPREWLSASSEVNQRTWKFRDFDGVDAKGKLANGNYWRYFGMLGESIKYYDVPPAAAAYFDRVIDDVCFMEAGIR